MHPIALVSGGEGFVPPGARASKRIPHGFPLRPLTGTRVLAMSGGRDPRLRELGAFLRARRGDARPDAVGVRGSDPRRQVTGLRREEVAERAFISCEYYTRIEQGRVPPSREVLDQLITALLLDDDQARYARQLLMGPGLRMTAASTGSVVPEQIRRLLARFGDLPALVVGSQTSILAWNDAAIRMFVDFAEIPVERRTYVNLLFDNAIFQSRFRDLGAMQDVVVGVLRSTATDTLADGAHVDGMQELADRNAAFRERWHRFTVAQPREQLKIPFRDPHYGDIEIDQIVLMLDDLSQRLLVFIRSSDAADPQFGR